MLADWVPGLFVRDWMRRNHLRRRFTDLDDAAMVDEERFADLWHFDPWWVLGDERYQSVPCGTRTSPATTRQFPGLRSMRAWDARRTW